MNRERGLNHPSQNSAYYEKNESRPLRHGLIKIPRPLRGAFFVLDNNYPINQITKLAI